MPHVRPLQWVTMTTAVVACLWFSTGNLDPFNIPKLAVLVVGAAVLVGLLGAFWKQWFRREEWPVWGPVALFILGLTAAGIASNQNAYRTLWGAWARNDGWFAYASLAVILLAVAVAFRGADVRLGLYALIGVGAFEIAYGTLQHFGHDPVTWNNGYNPIIGTVGNPDFASALIGVCGVAMAWAALERRHAMWLRAGFGVLSLLAALLTRWSGSIQGTLAWGAGIAGLIAAWLSTQGRPALRRLLWPYVAVVGVLAAVAIVGMTNTGPFKSFMYKQNLVNRTYYWRAGWYMFRDHPLFGVGLDSFGDYYRVYRLPEQVAVTGIGTVSNAAHSIVFQMMATGGIAFFGTYVLLQGVVVWRGVKALRSGENRMIVAGALAAWLAFLLQSLFSIDQLGLTVWGWVISGLVIGSSYANAGAPKSSKAGVRKPSVASGTSAMPALVAGVVLGMGAVVLVAGPLSTDSAVRTAISYGYNTAQPNTQAQAAIAQAVMDSAGNAQDPYMRAQGVSKLFQIGEIEQGIALAQVSAKAFPMDATLWQLAATAYEQTNRAKLATPWRARALELDPLNTDYAKLLAQDKAAK